MKKWALGITVAFFAIVSVAAGAVALTDDGGHREPPTACTMEYPNKCTATAAARADLAKRLSISEDQITVKSVDYVEWPDSCLGIAKRDIACAEVITPGYRIILEANGRLYEYHTDGGSRAELVE